VFEFADRTRMGQLMQLGHTMKGYSENDDEGTLPHAINRT
jgi:hypothetical protein